MASTTGAGSLLAAVTDPKPCIVCGKPVFRHARQLATSMHPWCKGAKVRAARLRSATRLTGADHPNWRGGPIPRPRTAAWKKLCLEVRTQAGFRCQRCGLPESENMGKDGVPRALAVDHVRPYRLHGEDTTFAALCLRCHGKKGQMELKAFWKGDVLDQNVYEKAVRR